MTSRLYTKLYNNLISLFKYNGIDIVSEDKNELELFNNIKIGSYERIEIDGKKNGKDYKIVLLPEQNKYTKKKNSLDLLQRYQLAYHKIIVVCVKEEQINKLNVVVKSLGNDDDKFIVTGYKPFMYNLITHCHGNTVSVLSEDDVELLKNSYKLDINNLPKNRYNIDALMLWHFDLVKKNDVIVIDDISDNSGGIPLYMIVI